jgi:hypothetical protein
MSARQINPVPTAAAKQASQASFEMLCATIDLHTRGFSLLPIGANKLPYFILLPRANGKATWRSFQSQRATVDQICQWCQQAPDMNIGIICGNGLLVVDVDGDKGRTTLEHLGAIPPTVTALTGRLEGGTHYYLRLKPGRWKRNVRGEELHNHGGIDLQLEGRYVIAPPSLHPSGRRYRWQDGHDPATIIMADAPEWLYDYLEEVSTSAALEPSGTDEGDTQGRLENTELLKAPIDLYKSIGVTDSPVLSALGTDPWSLACDYQAKQKMARECGLAKEVWVEPGPANADGLRVRSGAFFCILPGRGHQDRVSMSASLFIDARTGCLKYRCWHGGLEEGESQTRLIWEVYYSLKTKDTKGLKGATLNFWLKLLLTRCGAWTLPDVACRGPETLSAPEVQVFQLFIQTYAIWQLLVPGTPVLFSWRYAAGVTGLKIEDVEKAMKGLQSKGFIRPCGKKVIKFGQLGVLYRPVAPRASTAVFTSV